MPTWASDSVSFSRWGKANGSPPPLSEAALVPKAASMGGISTASFSVHEMFLSKCLVLQKGQFRGQALVGYRLGCMGGMRPCRTHPAATSLTGISEVLE